MDIPLEGGSYTLSNSLSSSKIDRFLFSSEWEEHYPNFHKKWLVSWMVGVFISDACCFVLRTCGFRWMVLWGR